MQLLLCSHVHEADVIKVLFTLDPFSNQLQHLKCVVAVHLLFNFLLFLSRRQVFETELGHKAFASEFLANVFKHLSVFQSAELVVGKSTGGESVSEWKVHNYEPAGGLLRIIQPTQQHVHVRVFFESPLAKFLFEMLDNDLNLFRH